MIRMHWFCSLIEGSEEKGELHSRMIPGWAYMDGLAMYMKKGFPKTIGLNTKMLQFCMIWGPRWTPPSDSN